MKYALLMGILGAALLFLGISSGGWATPLLVWSGVAFGGVGLTYGAGQPQWLGKRSDGGFSPWRALLFLPYLLPTWALWHIQRRLTREPACSQIAPGLWLGRRPLPRELPEDVRLVVDLTAEFPEHPGVIEGRDYLWLPCLDAAAPMSAAFKEAVETVCACPGETYIHCALGHGRSATLVMGVLLRQGLADSVEEAEALVQRERPAIGVSKPQRALLAIYTARL